MCSQYPSEAEAHGAAPSRVEFEGREAVRLAHIGDLGLARVRALELREQSPGRYESYVDLEPGVWTKIRIVIAGGSARLFVDGASQPGTVGYCRNLCVRPRSDS